MQTKVIIYIMDMNRTPRTPEIDKLYDDVLAYRSTAVFKDLLQFIRKFRDMAPYNAMLVQMQKPGSTYVASVSDWQYRFGRIPKLGARPLIILRPFGPVAFVYELEDTEGRPVPDEILNPFTQSRAIGEHDLSRLIMNLRTEGIRLAQQNYGSNLGGFITSDVEETVVKIADDKSAKSIFAIVLNGNHTITSKYITILHELGHLFCGHLYKTNAKWLPQRYGLSHEKVEFEAETVNWLVCERLGIENNSARYLSGYLEQNEVIPEVSVDKILKAVGIIESLIHDYNRSVRKELLVKK